MHLSKSSETASASTSGNRSYRFGLLLNTLSVFLGRGLTVAAGIVLAKTLAPEILGRFAGDQTLVLVGSGLVNLGIAQGYRQITSRQPELRDTYMLPSIMVRIITILMYLGAVMIYSRWAGRLSVNTVLVVFTVLMFQLLELFVIDLQAVRDYTKTSILLIGEQGILLLAAIICWQMGSNYDYLVYSYLGLTLLIVVLGWLFVKPASTSLINFDYSNLFKISIPFAASIITYAFTAFWALTYIREVLGEQQAGYYYVPLKVYQIGLVIGMSASGVTLPLYHKLASEKDFATFATVFKRLNRGIWLLVGPTVAICSFIPHFLVKVFATEEYLAAVPIFPWIGFGFMCRLLAVPTGNVLESVDKQWYRVMVQTIGSIFCVLAVLFVVPKWGITGAGMTLCAVDLWLLLGYWYAGHRFAPKVVTFRDVWVPLAVLLAILCIVSISFNNLVWVKLLLFCVVWTIYVLFPLGFKEELRHVWRTSFRTGG